MSRGTLPRSVRVPSDLWESAVSKAGREGTTVTAVVLAALQEFTTNTKGSTVETLTIGRVSHLVSREVYREVDAYYSDGVVISDRCAVTIASWLMSPGAADMPFTQLAQGTPVALADVRDAIERQCRQYTILPNLLDAIRHWAASKSTTTTTTDGK